MSVEDRTVLPPVRLPPEEELAREALATPLLSRAAELARWSAPGVPVGFGGELLAGELRAAVTHLGLQAEPDGPAQAAEAWAFAVDTGLVSIEESEESEEEAPETPAGTASAGGQLGRLTEGGASVVLDIWSEGVEAVLYDAALAGIEIEGFEGFEGFEEGLLEEASEDDESGDFAADDLDEPDWDMEEESALLESALCAMYLFAAAHAEVAQGASIPLPVIAAAVVLPEGADQPSEDDVEDMAAVMMRLDEQFDSLNGTGLLEYAPPEASEEKASEGKEKEGDGEPDLDSFGRARLTPLGLYAVRGHMLEAGFDAPLLGDLRRSGARDLLDTITYLPETAAREEARMWLAEREPLPAARELLAAARGADREAPSRRLGCQLVLSLLNGQGDAALREVLDEAELGGLARVLLTGHGAADVPPPDEEMTVWLAIDTLAGQLDAAQEPEDDALLAELMLKITGQHGDLLERAWRSDHPATTEVLDAMGRLHPDPQLAKQARKAAFKTRSGRAS